MLKDNGSDAHHSYYCYGNTCFSPLQLVFQSGRRGEQRTISGVRDVGHNFTSVDDIVAYLCGFSSRTLYLICGPALNLENKYTITMLTREEWTRGPGTPSVVKGLVWFTDLCRMKERTRAGTYGQYVGRLSVSVVKCATDFQTKICAILTCAYEIQMNGRSEKYVIVLRARWL